MNKEQNTDLQQNPPLSKMAVSGWCFEINQLKIKLLTFYTNQK
jgi:hypothetical protein